MKSHSKNARLAPRHGFALVVTLSLMILLTVVAVGLLSLSSVTLRRSGNESAMEVARANARLALMMALGELQVHLGPDTRVSARAETLAKHENVGGTVTPNTPQAWWVGVADSDKTKTLRGSTADPVVWLVSGQGGNTPAAKITSPLHNPVTLLGEGSLDLSLTGGRPLEGGRVDVRNSTGKTTGAYAWYVDDNGMKAQLTASRPEVRNDSTAGPAGGPFGGGVIPGSYPVGILDHMAGLNSTPTETLLKLVSTNNLPLAKLSPAVTKSKFFSYTTSSRGVLSDVKKGGLKKDLTIAFENPSVFNNVFPTTNPDKYIVVDPQKRATSTELASGYINWAIFKDYYNLKKYIFSGAGGPSLSPTAFEKAGFVETPATDAFRTGLLGPHRMAQSPPSTLSTLPYGAMNPSPTGVGTPSGYRFNPISPVLQSMQETAWVSQVAAVGSTPAKVRTNVQLFTSHYNPYNVSLTLVSAGGASTRVLNYPQVLFTVNGTTINKAEGLGGKLQTHVPGSVVLEPGRSHVMGFSSDKAIGSEIDGSSYSQAVGTIVSESVYKDHTTTLPATGSISLSFEFALMNPALMHGIDEEPGDKELCQVFFSPFAWDSITTSLGPRPGKKIVKTASLSQLPNTKATVGFRLRTTREPGGGAIRPLMDANIRAVWNNPRWDSPLGLPLLAAYTPEGNGEITSQPIPQMEIGSGRRGFSYWGNSRSPSTGNDRVILFDVPRRDLVSLGQLQHANAGRFSYEPTYIVGNSYANPRIPLNVWKATISDTFSAPKGMPAIGGGFNLYDASYLVNDTMFDSYIFTTLPQLNDDYGGGGLAISSNTYTGLLKGSLQLPNPRLLPYQPAGSEFTQTRLQEVGNATSGSFYHNAGHVMVDGAFNVNSTSVDAWEAFLSGTHQLPVQKISAGGAISGFHPVDKVRFPRATSHLTDGMATSSLDSSYWTGFRELEQTEVRQIATRIVDEIKQRGPFLSLGDFVNRKLETTELGKSGALQAALDATVNKGLNSTFESDAATGSFNGRIATDSTQGAGFPGQLLQGDLLQALSPCMTVRSDTFTIRAYGEARDGGNNTVAKAWCEATVQRLPDPIDPPSTTASNSLAQLAMPTSPFGRRFEVLSFRWLHPDEV